MRKILELLLALLMTFTPAACGLGAEFGETSEPVKNAAISSLVILYDQNGEQFERQHIGHIDSGVEVFENTGDVDITFEVVAE